MKAKEQVRLDAIRMIKTALTKARADANKTFDEKAGQDEIVAWVESELYRLTGFKPEDRVIEAMEEVQPGIEGKRER